MLALFPDGSRDLGQIPEGSALTRLPGKPGTHPLTAELSVQPVGRLIFLSWFNPMSASPF